MTPNPINPPRRELREAVFGLAPYFKRAALFGLIASILVLAPSGYMLEVYDRVVNSRNHYTLVMLTLLVLWAYAVMETLEWARGQVMQAAGHELDHRLGDRVFMAMFTANLRRQPGGTHQTVGDFRTVREFLSSPAVAAVMTVPVSILFLALVASIHPVLGAVALVAGSVQLVVGWLNERFTHPPLTSANRSAFAANQYSDGVLRNAQVVEAMGMQRDIHERWMTKQREFLSLQAVASERAGAFQAITHFIQLNLSSGLLGLAAYLVLEGHSQTSGGQMIVSSILGGRVLAPLSQIIAQWRTVVNFRDAWARLDEVLNTVPPKAPSMPLPAPRGSVQVEGVVAGAPGTPAPILRGIAFALKPGEVLAVVGPSASGKTTLARVLTGLWPTAGGKVRLEGVDVFGWDKSELGPNVGYLPQEVELFDGTIAENIARFGEVEMHKVEAAANAVGLHEFIAELPQGYDTPVGGDGDMLSGGQRQRVGLARALYGEPAFVVLDEPNSSLDEAGDAALVQAVRERKARGTTFVLMTHRTSILPVADKMLVLRDGQQQVFGAREEVMAALAKAALQAQQGQQGQRPGPGAPPPKLVTARR
ncbi:MAG TPA: type I secretion system permease/ATPase [Ramlibacter sp.]|uniref:type I secretion system permease/ATPase n=1 Tax=Ramlibacter sp. TaxID=1917967 RepID=UPI002BB5DAEF|nr:type I secretion system permease/ATPase [Ramlibacter sp.]HVZ46145.1 type I secretion system permease/ATPase [Ramlibacter sp.]